MRRCALALWLVVGARALANAEPFNDPCYVLALLNENAAVPLGGYEQNNFRGMPDYRALFHPENGKPEFHNLMNGLKPGQVVIDVGSGKGIAMLQLAAQVPGVHTIGINAQNPVEFYNSLDGLGAAVLQKGTDALIYGTQPNRPGKPLLAIGEVRIRELRDLAEACGFPAPDWMFKPPSEGRPLDFLAMARDLDALAKRFHQWRATAKVDLPVGDALTIVRQKKGTADVLVDVYGAFFYGADRLELLQAYYEALKPGGTAFISLVRYDQYGGDVVLDPSNARLPESNLPSFLAGRFHDIFDIQITPRGERFLVIHRPVAGPDTWTIPLKVKKREDYNRLKNGYVVPKLTMEVTK